MQLGVTSRERSLWTDPLEMNRLVDEWDESKDSRGEEMTTTMPSLEDIQAGFKGTVLVAESDGYDDARALYSGNHDKFPQLIIRCQNTTDVVAAVNLGRDMGLPTAIRGP